MQLATRLDNLGTETAFAVSLAAAEWAAKGHKVYPFHLGDIALPTPHNIVEVMDQAIADGKTGYCAAAGITPLRDALAHDVGMRRGLQYTAENVVVQPGGKPVITKFIQSVVNPGEGVLYPNPGYPIYESQIEYFGAKPLPYRYTQTANGFAIDMDYLKSLITPSTRALIYNNLQNPLASESTLDEIREIADLAKKHNLWVLSDEAYFEMRYSGTSTSIASLPGMQERTVILYTFSKKFAMTGWRLGAAIGPANVVAAIAKLNTNDESCTTHFVQVAGVEALTGSAAGPDALRNELHRRRDAACDILQTTRGVSCPRPDSTFYLFANVTEAMDRMDMHEVADFATAALHDTGVSFCTRRHFGKPLPGETQHYVRFAYSGIDCANISEGLGLLKQWIESK